MIDYISKKNSQLNILLYYIVHILSGASLIVPITILYYLAFGLTYFEIGLLQSIFLFTSLFFEIPTGALADKIGRKYATSIGVFIIALGTAIIGIGSSFFIFAIAQIFFGIGASLRSGADSALIYDTLIESNQSGRYSKIEGKSFALFSIAGVIASPIGAHLFLFNHRWPFFFDGVFLLMAAAAYFFMREPRKGIEESQKKGYFLIIISGFKEIIKAPVIRWYLMLGIFLSLVAGIFSSLLSQPFLVERNVNIVFIGYIFSVVLLIQAIGSMFAHRIEAFLKENLTVFLVFFIPGIAFILMSYYTVVAVMIFFFITYYFNNGFQYPIIKDYFQRRIPSALRATILSVQNFFENLLGLIFIPIFGLLIDKLSVINGLFFLGILTIGAGSLIYFFRPLKNFNKKSALS